MKRLITAFTALTLITACETTAYGPQTTENTTSSGAVELEAVSRIERISDYSFDETLSRLRAAINERQNIRIISTVDHMRNASSVGKQMLPNTVLTFGNPRAGTDFMTADPRIGLHLPLKMQVYERPDGEVRIAYQDIDSLARRFEITAEAAPVAGVRQTLADLARTATRPQ